MIPTKFTKYDLNRKVDQFLDIYTVDLKKRLTDFGNFSAPRELRDFIESKAVYAELRWPQVYGVGGYFGNEHSIEDDLTWSRFNELKPFRFSKELPDIINLPVLYRIIERGGNRIGPRRGVLFAQDFGLDMNIPVSYGIDWSDPHLYEYLEQFRSQLNIDTLCPVNYFSRNSFSLRNVDEMRLEKVLAKLSERKVRDLVDT